MFGTKKHLITAVLLYVWITKGLYSVIGGPTMIDLMLTLDLTHEEVARALSATGFGPFPAIIASVIITDRFGNQKMLVMAVSQMVCAAAVFCVPFTNNVHALWCVMFILGLSRSVLNFVGQRILLETWEEKSPSPMHAMHMGFGIGALLAPLIANPFLAVTSTELTTTNSSNINMSNETSSSNATHSQETTIVIEDSRVEFVFIIIAILTLIGSLPFWFAQVRKCMLTGSDEKVVHASRRETERKTFREIVNPASYTGGSIVWGIVILILIFFIYSNVVGGEHSYGNFIRTYSVDVLKFTKDNASYLNLTYWLFHTLGRFSTFIIARWVPIRYLFFIEISLYLITTVAVYFVASSSQLSLWIFTAVVGFVVSPIYASGIAYANTQVEVRGIMMTCIELSGGLGVAFYVWITGYLYDSYGPRAMLLAMLITGIAVCVSSVLFLAVGYFRGNRFKAIDERVFEQQMNVIDDNHSRKSTEPCISAQ